MNNEINNNNKDNIKPCTEVNESPHPQLIASRERSLAQRIADQNDIFRKNMFAQKVGADFPIGKYVLTEGIAAQGDEFRQEMFQKLQQFVGFDEEADPHDWHEMGILDVAGEKVWFKIDLFDENYEFGAEEPDNLDNTRRVLTLLFPSEY